MKKQRLFIANWKMNLSFQQLSAMVGSIYDDLLSLVSDPNISVVLCPSFESIFYVVQSFSDTGVCVGSQDCSSLSNGNFTGQVAARSLREIGCSYGIVGHSERRTLLREADYEIIEKCHRLLESSLIPILCLGETSKEHALGLTFDVLKRQLSGVLTFPLAISAQTPLIIAYEPVWAIGTGAVPSKEHLEGVFDMLYDVMVQAYQPESFKMIYGGSVVSSNSANLSSISHLDGFLIGRASLDFQELKNIIDASMSID